jgi:hypothetical protein
VVLWGGGRVRVVMPVARVRAAGPAQSSTASWARRVCGRLRVPARFMATGGLFRAPVVGWVQEISVLALHLLQFALVGRWICARIPLSGSPVR